MLYVPVCLVQWGLCVLSSCVLLTCAAPHTPRSARPLPAWDTGKVSGVESEVLRSPLMFSQPFVPPGEAHPEEERPLPLGCDSSSKWPGWLFRDAGKIKTTCRDDGRAHITVPHSSHYQHNSLLAIALRGSQLLPSEKFRSGQIVQQLIYGGAEI